MIILSVDHYSDSIEIDKLENTLGATVVEKSKAHFSRHGIPEILVSDNGPQFIGVDFASFCNLYDITHITSSPYYPRGNAKAEAAVKVAKSLMKKSSDFYLALLHYRNTPQQGHTKSPAQRSLSRCLRSNLPVHMKLLLPESESNESELIKAQIAQKRLQAKVQYDKTASFQTPKQIDIGDYVYMKPNPRQRGSPWKYGQVMSTPTPRSYVIKSDSGLVRRNQKDISTKNAVPTIVNCSRGPQGGTNTLGVQDRNSPVHASPETVAPCVQPDVGSVTPSTTIVSVGTGLPVDGYVTRSGRCVKKKEIYDPSN